MEIRAARPGDEDFLAAVDTAAREDGWDADVFRSLLAKPATIGLVAEERATPVAYVLCQGAGGEAEILMIATHPTLRGMGIGFALLDTLRAILSEQGVTELFLEVAADNAPARALYSRAGFAEIGLRPGYYKRRGQSVDALIMRLDLKEIEPGASVR